MNKRTWRARLVPLTLATQLFMASSYAQPLPPARVTAPQNTAAAHVHAPGQLESSHEEIQKTRAASAANRSSRLFMPANAAQCSNGDFEFNTFAGWNGKDGSVVAGPGFTWSNTGISSGTINASTAHQTLVGPGTDPYAPVSTTAPGTPTSTKAVRIGNGVRNAGAEALTKTFTVTQATMNFKYALVLEDPGHSPPEQPGFEVRVFNASGVDITKKTSGLVTRPPRAFVTATDSRVVANASNPFFQVSPTPGPNGGAKVVYKDWTCSSIDLGDLMGQTVTVEFITNDCTQSGHAGWAYIDDICGVCDPINTPDGTVTLNQGASTDCGPGKLCFDFTIPKSKGAAPGSTQLSLQLYQNGVAVGSPMLSPIQNGDGQWCYPMPPVGLNASLGGFDWVVTSTNKIGTTTLTPKFVGTVPNGVINGNNNDYAFACKDPGTGANTCCPPMDNPTIKGLFDHAGNVGNTYTEKFGTTAQSAANVAAFIANYNAYLTLIKWSCPSVASLRVDFNLYSTTMLGGPLTGAPLATNTLTFTGGAPSGSTSFFNTALNNNQFYGIQAITTTLDANGRAVQCGFDKKCLEDDRYTWNHQVGARLMAPGASGGR